MVVQDIEDILEDDVDLVIEDVSTQLAVKIFPKVLKNGKDIIITSIAAPLDLKFKNYLERIALENNCRIYALPGDIVGLDGVKAVSWEKSQK